PGRSGTGAARRKVARFFGRRLLEEADGVEDAAPMADGGDADFLQVFRREAGQQPVGDVVFAKRIRVAVGAAGTKPRRYVHGRNTAPSGKLRRTITQPPAFEAARARHPLLHHAAPPSAVTRVTRIAAFVRLSMEVRFPPAEQPGLSCNPPSVVATTCED